MAARGAVYVLRERIGTEATDALSTMMNESTRSMAEEVTRVLGDRLERRLTEEISDVRIEMHRGFGKLNVDVEKMRSSATRWAFLFWIGQLATVIGLFGYLK